MNILITGANGFIGSNLSKLLENNLNLKIFKGNRDTIDLYSKDNIKKFIEENEINKVIHCAIEGGHRLKPDNESVVYKNILMFENLAVQNLELIINIGSGAEYDRRYDISCVKPESLFSSIPIDYYGFSKNIISKLIKNNLNIISLYVFNCFYHNELQTRFIKNSLTNYINGQPIIIHQDRYLDFFYMEDLANVINFLLFNSSKSNFINMSYETKYKLSDIAIIINNLNIKKVKVIIENPNFGLNYTGNGELLNNLNLNLKKLELGIKECYDVLK